MSNLRRRLLRGPVGLLAVAAVLVAGSLLLSDRPPAVQAAPVNITAGQLNWGFKASFRGYITGPIARGKITVGEGAAQTADGFTFSGDTGTHDSAAGTVSASFKGNVHFLGHCHDADNQPVDLRSGNPAYTGCELDLNFKDPRVTLDGNGGGSVVIDLLPSNPDLAIASLTMNSVVPSTSGSTVTYTMIAANITDAGRAALNDMYAANSPLDALTFTLTLAEAGEPGPGVPIPVLTLAVVIVGGTGGFLFLKRRFSNHGS